MIIAASSFLGSPVGLLVVLGLCFVAVFVVTNMLLGARARSHRDRSLAERIGKRAPREEPTPAAKTKWLPSSVVGAGQRFAVATGFSAGLDERLEQAGLPMMAGEFLALTAFCVLLGAVFAGILLQNIIFVLLVAAATGAVPYFWVARARRKREQKLHDQLADTLSILASSLRAGYSFLQALDTVSKEIGDPSASEFQRVVAEIRLGRPIDEALIAMATRINSEDLKWAVIAINVQREVGGNLAEVLDIVSNTVRERAYIRRQVQVLSAEGRFSVAILSGLPFAIMLYMVIVNPKYINPLFTTPVGWLLLTVGGSMIAIGIFIMTRMIKIDV